MWSRRAYLDAAGCGKISGRNEELRGYGAIDLSTGRGNDGRRTGNDRGWIVRPLSCRCSVRHAQHAGAGARQALFRERRRNGCSGQLGDTADREGRPRIDAGAQRRSCRRRFCPRDGITDNRRAQCLATQQCGGDGGCVSFGQCRQCDCAVGDSSPFDQDKD